MSQLTDFDENFPEMVVPTIKPPVPVVHQEKDGREKSLLRLSQSTIKRLTDENSTFCPRRYFVYEIEGQFKQESSEAQIKGQLFEYLALGNKNKEGFIPRLPQLKTRNKDGDMKSADEKRIEIQAQRFVDNMPEYGIEVINREVYVEMPYEIHDADTGETDTILLHGTIDAVIDYEGRPYLMDLKMTSSLKNTFGPYAWGNYWQMNHIQAYIYTYIMYHLDPEKRTYGWVYYVADLTPEEDYKLIEIKITNVRIAEMKEGIRQAWKKYRDFEAQGFAPAGDFHECKTCQVMDCSGRKTVRDPEVFN